MTSARGLVLITGAARRVGRVIALHLAQAGWDILAHYRNAAPEAESLAAEIRALGRSCDLLKGDFEDPAFCPALPPLTGLVHNASLFERDETDPTGARHRRVNYEVPLALTRRMADGRPEGAEGSVVFFLDNTPLPPFLSAYAASRALLRESLPGLARELAPRLRANALALGPTLRAERESEEHFEAMVRAAPLARAVAPNSVANAVRFLLETPEVTGEILNLDSGLHLGPRP